MGSPQAKSVELKISEWLDSQGYPLEMLVAREFQRADFRVFQSDYYTDPETGIPREIDISAYTQQRVANVLLRVSVSVECKSSTEKPWIIFTSENVKLASPARVAQRAASSLGVEFLMRLSQEKDIQSLNLFLLPERPGYGVTQAFTTGKDIPYEAAVSVAKCVDANILEVDKANKRQGPIIEIMFPVIITNAKLFECYLDQENKLAINEVNMGVLVWRNQLIKQPHTIIRVSTVQDLPNLIREVRQAANFLFKQEDALIAMLAEIEQQKKSRADAVLAQGKAKRK